jgi:hypothetical protein
MSAAFSKSRFVFQHYYNCFEQLFFTAVIAVLSAAATSSFLPVHAVNGMCTLRSCFRHLYSFQRFKADIDD